MHKARPDYNLVHVHTIWASPLKFFKNLSFSWRLLILQEYGQVKETPSFKMSISFKNLFIQRGLKIRVWIYELSLEVASSYANSTNNH